MAQPPKTPTQRQIAEEINSTALKYLPKTVVKRLESIPKFGAYKLPIVSRKSKLQPSSTTEVWSVRLFKPVPRDELERIRAEFLSKFSKFAFYYNEKDISNDCMVERVHGGTSAPLEPSEVFGLHRYLHEKLGYLEGKGDCVICPVSQEDPGELGVYTVVIGFPDNLSMCPIGCRYCYAKPTAPDTTLIRKVEDMRDEILKRIKLIVENIVTDVKASGGGVPFVNIILWGGNSDPTVLSNDYYSTLIEEFTEWVYEKKKAYKKQWYMAFAFNLSTSADDVNEIRRMYTVLDDMREKIYNKVSRDDWDILGYHDSMLAVTAYRPDLYHTSSENDDAAFRYMERIFKLPSPRVDREYRFNVFATPVFIVDSVIDAFVDYIVASAYWLGYIPLILAPYGNSSELYRYFKVRNTGQVGNIATKLLWKLLHVFEKIKIDTCSYNAIFGGILTPQIYSGHFIRIHVDPLNNKVSHVYHDGSWCPRGAYTGRGCIYPPRPPPSSA
jgi:hypothetical protein